MCECMLRCEVHIVCLPPLFSNLSSETGTLTKSAFLYLHSAKITDHHPPHLAFVWMLGVQTQSLLLAQASTLLTNLSNPFNFFF